jgi:hypothetical protein
MEMMSPLADPVVEEIYKDEHVAGLAAGSFIGAVLSECGEVFGTEVYAMEPRIKEFVEGDAGASQFIARYDEAAASPAVRRAYEDWVLADFRERSLLQGARDEGRIEGEKDGKKEERFAIAKNAIAMKMSISQIEQLTGLTGAQIEKLQR